MKAAKTIEYFSYYLTLLGLGIIALPNLMSALIFLPPPADQDYLFVGFLLLLLAYYYRRMAQERSIAFFQATVLGRLGIFTATLIWVIFGALPPNYLILLVIDAAGACWTAQALRAEGHSPLKAI